MTEGLQWLPEYKGVEIELVDSKGKPWSERSRGQHYYRIHGYPSFPEPLPSITNCLGIIDKSAPLIAWSKRVTLEHVREKLCRWEIYPASLTKHIVSECALSWECHYLPTEVIDEILAAAKAESDRQRDAAADTGTSVHGDIANSIECYLEDGFHAPFGPPLKNAWDWMVALGLTPVAAEVAVFHPVHGTPGTVDLVARDSDGQLCIADWKSGNGLYESHAYQVSVYARNIEALTGEPVAAAYAVQLPKPGETIQCWMCHGADNIACATCGGAGTIPYNYKKVADIETGWRVGLAAQQLFHLSNLKVW